MVDDALEKGFNLCQEWDVMIEKRVKRKKRMAGESALDAGLTAKEEMSRVMKGSLDRIVCEMTERFTRLHETDARFGFLLDIETLCYGADDCDN